ncbi:MAG: hypothetical protein ABNH26_12860 [Celeribacter sp.]|jgi:hypothetical protein
MSIDGRGVKRLLGVLCALQLASPAIAQQREEPLSVIDWLSNSVATPVVAARPQEAPISSNALPADVTVRPLGAPAPDAVGLFSPNVTGLSRDFWAGSDPERIMDLIRSMPTEPLPAVQALFRTILLTSLTPPAGIDPPGQLYETRIDALLARGALEEAAALLARADVVDPDVFQRAFDVALLTGQEDQACARMRRTPGIAPSFPARIFCLARTGDWPAAALTLGTAEALGQLAEGEDAILSRFLDPEMFEDLPPLSRPVRPSPLTFRMFEAIGEPVPTSGLPVAFAHSDLRGNSGWKARIEAAERLARRGALDPNALLGIWTEREPAASGGLWDRLSAVQRLDAALEAGASRDTALALEPAWDAMRASGLEVPFAELFGERLAQMNLPGPAGEMAFRIGLLSTAYEAVALDRIGRPASPEAPQPPIPDTLSDSTRFLLALARGTPADAPATTTLSGAIQDGFDRATELRQPFPALLDEGLIGEAVLQALHLFDNGAGGDPSDIATAIAVLHRLGHERVARSAALQLLLTGPEA